MEIQITSLTKSYTEGTSERRVLEHVDALFPTGKITLLLGQSGSGKSTLLNLLGGIDHPDQGEVWVGDTCISALQEPDLTRFRHQNIGMVFQFFHLLPHLSVIENILLPTQLGPSPSGARERARSLLASVGLQDREQTLPERLSGGEQQRVALARALIQKPTLLLADEPTGNLDAQTGEQVIQLLIQLTRNQGSTLVMATHNAQYASLADQVFRVENKGLILL